MSTKSILKLLPSFDYTTATCQHLFNSNIKSNWNWVNSIIGQIHPYIYIYIYITINVILYI